MEQRLATLSLPKQQAKSWSPSTSSVAARCPASYARLVMTGAAVQVLLSNRVTLGVQFGQHVCHKDTSPLHAKTSTCPRAGTRRNEPLA